MATYTDPVCGMRVDEQKAAGKTQFQGETYYFCSQTCKGKFEQNPQQYVQGGGQKQPSGKTQGGGSSR